ncbi:HesA/MoeB/ThiF family protein [Gordonia mangrovi]|nr:ThiF family adenylyltransferase [Gordonia mangrovi]UVF79202.1 ThiF family adenylyltransferase [Gordonia mangrovi]
MFSRRTSVTSRVAVQRPGTPWSITDEALARIDETIAAHKPERGGALIATRERIVVDFLADPRPGEQVSYWHSRLLADALTEHLKQRPMRHYGGTLHSHPGVYGEPSGPDHVAFANQLATNPTIRDALFPIVVRARRQDMRSVLRLGERHLVDLPNGTFAAYSAAPNEDTVEVRPAPIHVIPLHRDITHVCQHLSAFVETPVVASATREMEIEGRHLPAVSLHAGEKSLCTVVFPAEYPTQAPLLLTSQAGAVVPAWKVGHDSRRRLSDAVGELVRAEQAAASTASMDDRLSHHLPDGVRARYLVVGAGSVGSTSAEMLVRSGVCDLTVVDFDTVELPNLSRTTYDRSDVGMLKVAALQHRLREINPEVRMTAIDAHIQDLDLSILDDIDVAVFASDDLAGEFWLGHHLYRRGTPLVSVKMFELGEAGEMVTVVPKSGTACLRCIIGDPVGSGDRGTTDYGSGRLVSAPALGVDIIATVARGVRMALALGQQEGPLAEWISPIIAQSRTYFQQSSVPDHRRLTELRPGRSSPSFDSAWYLTGPRAECAVCGEHPEEPAAVFGGSGVPRMLPPGVEEVAS